MCTPLEHERAFFSMGRVDGFQIIRVKCELLKPAAPPWEVSGLEEGVGVEQGASTKDCLSIQRDLV